MIRISHTDQYGIVNYTTWFKVLLSVFVLYAYITLAAYPLLILEEQSPDANIKTYEDAFWLLQMACSTIGFGDFYPTTTGGRWIVVCSFYIGVGIASFIGATIAGVFTNFTDQSVQNRELRKQNEEILQLLKEQKQWIN